LLELTPTHGRENTIVTVVVQTMPSQMPVKLAFNSLMVDTKQMQAQGITSLVATVPAFQQTHSPTTNVPVSICFLNKDMVTETWLVADFVYEDQKENTTFENQMEYLDKHTTSDHSNDNAISFQKGKGSISFTSALPTPPVVSTPPPYGFKSTSHTPATSVANYQPYPGLVSRANLDIAGDLDGMSKNWSGEEWDHRRRLVQFWRDQSNNKIQCRFQPVPQSEHATANSGNIVVSCIYWMERNDFFITSVDCIYLLECLMDIRFSVEEKNRIRRNLEGFRPLTVSKCKTESADFFKLIMGFPNPKPRNIEKDVKVFPWKTLPYALKKIVTKYTASSYGGTGKTQRANAVRTPSMLTPVTPGVAKTGYFDPHFSDLMSAATTPLDENVKLVCDEEQ
ncbi:hypothetical protein K501DRAFT_195157, partial [Backusella circina FSU 941]